MAKLKELHEHASRLAEALDCWRKAYFAMYGYASQAEAEYERVQELSIALYRKIEGSPDVCNLDEFDEWEKALGGE